MLYRTVALLILAFMLPVSHGTDIYRWVDEKGNVHYGDSVREKAAKKAEKVDTGTPITDEQRKEAEARLAKEKALADAIAAGKEQQDEAQPGGASGSLAPPEKTATGAAEHERCEEQKRRYLESDACFAPFKLANGATRPEAFRYCVEVPRPDC